MKELIVAALLLVCNLAFSEEEYDKSIHLSGSYGEWRCDKGVVKLKIDGFITSHSDRIRLYFELSSGQNRAQDPFETMTISAGLVEEMAKALSSAKSVELKGKFKIQIDGEYSIVQMDVNGVWGFSMKVATKDAAVIGGRILEIGKIKSKISNNPTEK